MTAGSPRAELAAITAPLLEPATTIGETAAAVTRLEAFLERHTPFRRAETITEGETILPDGRAVSPTQAAMCARDFARTRAFARGLALAIDEARRAIAGRPVRVLYAGCGPWALIALPSMAALPDGTARFTLVDTHQDSIDSIVVLADGVGLGPSVDAIVRADAATWTIPGHLTPDVIITETMNVCLGLEPQVAITRNLLRQARGAILVPRSVGVDALLVDPDRERAPTALDGQGAPPVPDRIELGMIFEVSRETAASWPDTGHAVLPAGRIQMPASIDARYVPKLFTRIETYGGERIDPYESWLTHPRPFPDGLAAVPGASIAFRYVLGQSPRLEADVAAWPDRLLLPFTFDPARLDASLASLEASRAGDGAAGWTDHFVTRHYEGRWSVIPLRAPAGTETQHPILQIASHPGTTTFVDTPALARVPYLAQVLGELGFPLGAARLMRLDPGSAILTHRDADLDAAEGWARLHIPIRTNPGVEFLLNGVRVVMAPGQCWYLRLSDPHAVRNDGMEERVHLVIDAPVGPELRGVLERASQIGNDVCEDGLRDADR